LAIEIFRFRFLTRRAASWLVSLTIVLNFDVDLIAFDRADMGRDNSPAIVKLNPGLTPTSGHP
jgi:hypothetical protein